MLSISNAELQGLVTGETVVAFVSRGSLTEGDEVELAGTGAVDAETLKPAYRRWADTAAPEGYSAVVVSIDPAAVLDPVAGSARHLLMTHGEGDLALLRVFGEEGPVLSDDAFAARKRSVEGALRE